MPTLRSLTDDVSCRVDRVPFAVGNRAVADFRLDDALASTGQHFVIQHAASGYMLEPVLEVVLNGESISERTRLHAGDRIGVGRTLLVFEPDIRNDGQTRLGNEIHSETPEAAIDVPHQMKVILGRETSKQVHALMHSHVSRRHAAVSRNDQEAFIEDLGSSNGTYLNGERLTRKTSLQVGDLIGIGPFILEWDGDCLSPRTPICRNPTSAGLNVGATLSCRNLSRKIVGTNFELIKDVNLHFHAGEFVCIVGPSGAGKSTLLKALAHREPYRRNVESDGGVYVNDSDLYLEFERFKRQIAFVPQHEILFDELTLETALRFTAQLRLPRDVKPEEIEARVQHSLNTVHLTDCRHKPIQHLSGGQRKRAALANELISEPSLLFLDEVTSGLDELTDSEMMTLFRQIANTGKTVICVTHSLRCIDRDCDRIVGLTTYGRLGFDGSPEEAKKHFGLNQIGDIYDHLTASSPAVADELARSFRRSKSPSCGSDVRSSTWRMKSGARRKIADAMDLPEKLRQFRILLLRYCMRMIADSRSNALRGVQCLVVGGLLCSVFGGLRTDPTGPPHVTCAFILVLSSFWFGCNNSAKEIVRERDIFDQERRVGIEIVSFVGSKLFLLSVMSILQSIFLAAVVVFWCKLPGAAAAWCLICAVMASAGVAIGLTISAVSKTEEAAVAAVPILLIPQIILAGAVANLSHLNELVAKLFVASYWGLTASKSMLDLPEPLAVSEFVRPLCMVIAQTCVAYSVAIVFLYQPSFAPKDG